MKIIKHYMSVDVLVRLNILLFIPTCVLRNSLAKWSPGAVAVLEPVTGSRFPVRTGRPCPADDQPVLWWEQLRAQGGHRRGTHRLAEAAPSRPLPEPPIGPSPAQPAGKGLYITLRGTGPGTSEVCEDLFTPQLRI